MVVSESHNGRKISVRVGDVVELNLPDNATTGYRWTLADIDAALLKIENTTYRPSGTAVGSGGFAHWQLRALAPGMAHLSAKRNRPWEGDSSTIDQFSVTIDIA